MLEVGKDFDWEWFEKDASLNALDKKARRVFRALQKRAGEKWGEDTHRLCEEGNPELLKKLSNMESRVNSLLVMKQKPRELGKKIKEVFNEYERIVNCCIAYAQRLEVTGN